MQRNEMFNAMRGLGLNGMEGAFNATVTARVHRQHIAMEILSDRLCAEGAQRQAVDGKGPGHVRVRDHPDQQRAGALASRRFVPAGYRNVMLVGGTGIGKIHFASAIGAGVIRAGAHSR